MEDQHPEQSSAAAGRPGVAGVLRELFDLNTIFESGRPGRLRWWAVRIVLFALGSWFGGILWELVTEASEDRSWGERMLANVYFWTGFVTTGLYALHDRRKHRESSAKD